MREHYLLLFGAAGAIATVSSTIAAWLGARFGARRAARDAAGHAADDAARVAERAVERAVAALRPQLDGLRHTVESTAVEVERVAEAQRFAARLLAERTAAERAPRPDAAARVTPRSEFRVPTPH
ncbi:hypothetical protein J421_5253 (plasmid) [Gemmatirosa kalamazoonensis]|uniref:Uncharacterized protein n=2 Tax=Gemmatirosa kalamazoonensis TaxID=861299 RepID=W0RT85_9BACT|nr:hypothetical protein J421_5253 [Gemmatirosa kalamazoonensis]